MRRTFLPIVLTALLLVPSLARAVDACAFGVEPVTSGFPLNPILDKLTVTSAKPSAPGNTCSLVIGDQILEVNQRVVPGTRALKVHGYFKAIKEGALYTLKVKRGATTVIVTAK